MKYIARVIFFATIFVITADCIVEEHTHPELTVNLRWNKAYAAETRDSVNTGLLWAFSFLGAELTKGSYNNATQWLDETTIRIDLEKLGFNTNAQAALAGITRAISESEEYKRNHAIDAGRFIMILLSDPKHYYAITGVRRTFAEFRSAFTFYPVQVGLIRSSVSRGQRLIEMPVASDVRQLGYIAKEGRGSLHKGKFSVKEYEVFDVMPNGQLRFAIYDRNGDLKNGADPALSRGGKPAKCLWCHEININPAFAVSDSVKGYHSYRSFTDSVYSNRLIVDQYRQSLQTDIIYARKQDHTLMELLYISFMEPSAERLALEWNMSVDAVKKKLKGLPAHRHEEFAYLGALYHRAAVDRLSPYKVIKVPRSAREL